MFNRFRIVVYNDKLHIYNYNEIKEITNENIIVDNINIIGKNLLIYELNGYELNIKGIIKEVKIID